MNFSCSGVIGWPLCLSMYSFIIVLWPSVVFCVVGIVVFGFAIVGVVSVLGLLLNRFGVLVLF